jgi:hypothetical protein
MGDHFCHKWDIELPEKEDICTMVPVGENLAEPFKSRRSRRGGRRRYGGRYFKSRGYGYRSYYPYYSYWPYYYDYTQPRVINVTKEVKPEPQNMTPWFILIGILIVALVYKK